MSFSLVQSTNGSVGGANASSVTVATAATGVDNLLVAFVFIQGTGGVTITPPAGWSQAGSSLGVNGGTGTVALFYLQNSSSGVTSHLFSFSASVNAAVSFEEWSGVAISGALDQTVGQQNAQSATVTTGTTPALAGSGELAIWGLGVQAGSVLTLSSILNSYVQDTSAAAHSTKSTEALAYLLYNTSVGSAATSSGCTMSGNGGAGNTTILAVFKPAVPALSTSPTSLSFSATQGGSNPASQNDTLSETGNAATAWTSNISYGSGSGWLAISPTTGSLAGLGNATISFSCTTGSLTAGTYTATVTFTATTGGATATVTVSFVVSAPSAPPGYNVEINGVSVMALEGSFQEDDSISSVSTVSFIVRDDAGTSHFTKGMPVSISSVQNGLLYTGFVTAAVEDRVSPQTLIKTSIGARDNHTLAENRTYDGAEFTNQYAIVPLCAMLNTLSQEGITAPYAMLYDTTWQDFGAQQVQASDTFTRANQSGLGTASDGESYTLSGHAATEAIVSNEGVISATAGSDTHAQLGSTTLTDQQLQCRIAVNNANDIAGIEARFSSASGSTCYKLLWYSGDIHLSKSNAGVNAVLTQYGGFTMTLGTFYQFKLLVVGSVLYGKVWADGTAEPIDWMLTASDTSIASGGYALLANSNSGSGIQFDHFTVQLAGALATDNVDDGDLELPLAGVPLTTITDTTAEWNAGTLTNTVGLNNQLVLTSRTGIAFSGENNGNQGNNAYIYWTIWSGSYTIASGDTLEYTMWVNKASPAIQAGMDGACNEGSTLITFITGGHFLHDQNNIDVSPANDLKGYADDQWYTRSIDLSGMANGSRAFNTFSIGFEGNAGGHYAAYFHTIKIMNGGTTKLTIYGNNGSLNTSEQARDIGYSNISITTPLVYDTPGTRISNSVDLTSVGIAKTSLITYADTAPAGTTVEIDTSFDGGATWQPATSGQKAVLALISGASLSGVGFMTRQVLTITGDDPIVTPVVASVAAEFDPSYLATKNDVFQHADTSTQWNAQGTNQGGANIGNQITINGSRRNWDDGSIASQTLYGDGSPGHGTDRHRLFTSTNGAGNEVHDRFDFAGNSWKDFRLDIDITIPATANEGIGVVYRTTNWNNGDSTYGWVVDVQPNAIKLGYGSNTGATGTYTNVATFNPASFAPTPGSVHTLTVIVQSTTHTIYLDGVQYIQITSAIFNQAGYVATHAYNNSGANVSYFFDNFGIGSGPTGSYETNNISLNSVATVGDSFIAWQEETLPAGCQLLVQSTIDGGSTFQTCTNGAEIPGLTPGTSVTGKNLRVYFSLISGSMAYTPTLDGYMVWITSAFSSSAVWISPVVSLANVGRLGGSVVAWNDNLATGCTLGVDARVDSGSWVDVTSTPGGAVPGLTAQSAPALDSFDTNTSANYTNTFMNGGAAGTATFDTANSRLILSGGTNQIEEYNALSFSDGYVECDMDYADTAGPVLRMQDTSNLYYLKIYDDQAVSYQQVIGLWKNVAGSTSQIGSNAAISFLRGTIHRIHFEIAGTTITVNFDGLQVIAATDSGIPGPGKAGLYENSHGQFYSIRVQPFGQDVTTHTIQTRLRLASTNPLQTPQVLDHALVAFGTTLGLGALIPQTSYYHKYIDKNTDDLAKNSKYWWYIDKNLLMHFLATQAVPAPWTASDGGIPVNGSFAQGDFQDKNITVEDSSDLYRNRSIIDNVLASTTINEKRIGDGASTSWTFGNQWAGMPTLTVNGKPATVGVKNVDTGKDFYYAVGDPTITEDSSGPVYDLTYTLQFSGPGQYLTYSQADNLTEQAALAAVQGRGTGIVTIVEDGTGLTKAQGDTLAQARIDQYSVRGRLLKATTRRFGLAPGQLLTVFLPSHKLWDTQMLVRSVKTTLTTEYGIQQGWYEIEAISGPDVGDWQKLYDRSSIQTTV